MEFQEITIPIIKDIASQSNGKQEDFTKFITIPIREYMHRMRNSVLNLVPINHEARNRWQSRISLCGD
jgi:hypothetical protein